MLNKPEITKIENAFEECRIFIQLAQLRYRFPLYFLNEELNEIAPERSGKMARRSENPQYL